MRTDLRERLKNPPLLFDGGFGTELYNRGIFLNRCFEEVNLSSPELVLQIHKDYVKAGAEALETNTFGANYFKLRKYGLEDKLREINLVGAALARDAALDDVYVIGSVGPLSVTIEPLSPISEAEARDYFKLQIAALLEGGVDGLIFETFIYPNELMQAVRAARELTDKPVIAQLTIDESLTSLTGATAEEMALELEQTGADVIGINCTVGPRTMLDWLDIALKVASKPISIMPNAGKPRNVEGRNIYLSSPDYLGEYARRFAQAGATIIGGCCGVGPDHIKSMRSYIDQAKPEQKKVRIEFKKTEEELAIETTPSGKKSRLARKLTTGAFAQIVELVSPFGANPVKEIEKARELYYMGIDAINIPDGPRASARMAAWALAVSIQKEVGIETVLHYVCRDRNVIGMQSDLLGAYALGLKNILAITGDPPKIGNYPDATAVFDVDAIGLVNILSRLNRGLDIAGNKIGSPTAFFVGVGANPTALNIEEELRRLYWKVEAGAEYIITQPVFDYRKFESFAEKAGRHKLPVIAGLWPLSSIRNAEFLNNEIPGCDVPGEILSRLRKYEDSKEDSLKEGIDIARELMERIKPMIAGVQISAPFGRIATVTELLK
ncbi:MAG: bifunctional homocysteine S-methyltransferase/methylenetetrahydrofolate reductase [Chloroflexota bacterium]